MSWLSFEQADACLGVTDVAWSEGTSGDEAGVGFNGHMGFEAIAVVMHGFVHVA